MRYANEEKFCYKLRQINILLVGASWKCPRHENDHFCMKQNFLFALGRLGSDKKN